jgi:chaperonin GroES
MREASSVNCRLPSDPIAVFVSGCRLATAKRPYRQILLKNIAQAISFPSGPKPFAGTLSPRTDTGSIRCHSITQEDAMNFRPLHDRLIVKREAEERKSAGGIVIPDTVSEKPVFGKVLAVGPGKILDNGKVRVPDIKVGDKVLFGKFSGTEVKLAGDEIVVMREEDVMAVVES